MVHIGHSSISLVPLSFLKSVKSEYKYDIGYKFIIVMWLKVWIFIKK